MRVNRLWLNMGESFWPPEQPSFGTEDGANSVFLTMGVVARACLRLGLAFFPQIHAFISKSPPSIPSLDSVKYCKMYFHTTALIVWVAARPQGELGRELGDTFPFGLLSLGPLWLGAGSGLLGLWHSTTLSTALLSKSLPGGQPLGQLFEEKAWLLS